MENKNNNTPSDVERILENLARKWDQNKTPETKTNGSENPTGKIIDYINEEIKELDAIIIKDSRTIKFDSRWINAVEKRNMWKEVKEIITSLSSENKKLRKIIDLLTEENKVLIETFQSGGIPIEAFERIEQSLDNLKLEGLQNEIDKKNKTDNNKGTQ